MSSAVVVAGRRKSWGGRWRGTFPSIDAPWMTRNGLGCSTGCTDAANQVNGVTGTSAGGMVPVAGRPDPGRLPERWRSQPQLRPCRARWVTETPRASRGKSLCGSCLGRVILLPRTGVRRRSAAVRSSGEHVRAGNRGVLGGQGRPMPAGEEAQVGIGGPGGSPAPVGPGGRRLVIGQEAVAGAESGEHPGQQASCLLGQRAPTGALDGDADETQFRNRRGGKLGGPRSLQLSNPPGNPVVVGMIRPAPSHEQVHVEKVPHGKSASRWRTDSVSRAGSPAAEPKMMDPVWPHSTRGIGPEDSGCGWACRRRNSDTDN